VPNGDGPFPVFITQDNHRRWALIAVSRGYIGCVYAGADSRDDTGEFASIWPECDWTKLARRAWAASRCIDYLLTLPIVDSSRIAITGHSRNGKMSLMAAAMDRRIGAVISSSSGAGGSCTYRFFSEAEFGEGIEPITRVFPDWLHPRLRFFAGRENKLPIDQHELIACIAPRGCLISTAINDSVESVWAIEQTWYAARPVYDLLGAGDALQLRYRSGSHETGPEDIESYIDWLDTSFHRGGSFTGSEPIYPTYTEWRESVKEDIEITNYPEKRMEDLLQTAEGKHLQSADDWLLKKKDILPRIQWALGDKPPLAESEAGDYGMEKTYIAVARGRNNIPDTVGKISFNFGHYIPGDLYFPKGADKAGKKIPAVVWVHPLSNSNGYVAGYHRGKDVHIALAEAGFAVLAFDQIGNGQRISEIKNFYRRYPDWSLMGKMVEDVRASLNAFRLFDFVDPKRIFILGYAMGGTVALHAAALDERIAGVVSVAGFTPMSLDSLEKGTGGLRRWTEWLPLQPRLGVFVGNESRVPYDYHEVLACIAPRALLVVEPRVNYRADLKDIQFCVEEVRKVYRLLGSEKNVQLTIPDDYNRYSPEMQETVNSAIRQLAGI
jgi:pimeloyl-ACP methyl ester carboxylesterase